MRNSDYERDFEEEGGANIDFARAFNALRRRWVWIVAVTLVCAFGATVVTSFMPRKFHASAVVQMEPRKKSVSNIPGFAPDMGGDVATFQSEVEIIKSRPIAARVIEILKLQEDPEFVSPPGLFSNLRSYLGFLSSGDTENGSGGVLLEVGRGGKDGFAKPVNDATVDAFLNRLSVWRVRQSYLIKIGFWSSNPQQAALVANAVAEVYLSEQMRSKRQTTRTASQLLEERIKVLKEKVDAAERKVADFKIEYGMISSEGPLLSERALARLMEQTVLARDKTAEASAIYERARELRDQGASLEALTGVLTSHTVHLMKDKLANAMRRKAELATRYGHRHPEMQKVEAELRDARNRLSVETAKEVTSLENTFQQAKIRETELLKDLERSKRSEAGVTEKSTLLHELEREAATSRQILEALVLRFKVATETEDLQIADGRIVEKANTPLQAGSPRSGRMILFATIAGLGLSVIVVLALEFLTPGLGRPEDVERVLALAHLSSLPEVSLGGGPLANPALASRLVMAEPSGAFAEAIRAVRRQIDIRGSGIGSRVVLVAGSLPGEGSSVVAANLALHYAMSGHSVVLVDGDVRRSKLSNEVAPHRTYGLMDVLARSLPIEHAILRDTTSNLNFLPAVGERLASQPNPELLSTSTMARSVAELKRQFDVVIIDSPPLLPVVDGSVLADYADQILFVMGWRNTPKAVAKRALKCLAVNHGKIAGVVVNNVGRGMLSNEFAMGLTEPQLHMPRHGYAA